MQNSCISSERTQDPDLSLCADLQRVAELRQTVFREPELLEAVSEILVGKGVKTSIQPSGGREEPRHAQSAACAILLATLKVSKEWRAYDAPNGHATSSRKGALTIHKEITCLPLGVHF